MTDTITFREFTATPAHSKTVLGFFFAHHLHLQMQICQKMLPHVSRATYVYRRNISDIVELDLRLAVMERRYNPCNHHWS